VGQPVAHRRQTRRVRLETVSQISHNLLRTTRNTEQVRAGQLDIKAEDYARCMRTTRDHSKAITKVEF
jgi:hypothetical protein